MLAHEVSILSQLNHPNIVQYLGIDESEEVGILMEYVPGGSVSEILNQVSMWGVRVGRRPYGWPPSCLAIRVCMPWVGSRVWAQLPFLAGNK